MQKNIERKTAELYYELHVTVLLKNQKGGKVHMDEKLEKAAAQAKDKIAEQLDREQMKKTAQAVADKSKETFEKARNMAENIDTEEINKNVKEISTKTKEELNKHSKKEIAVGIIIVLVVLAVLSKLGWANVFTWLFLISLAYLIYDVVKKKPKKKAAIATIVFFVLTAVFASGDVGGKSELMDIYGMTPQEVEKQYGKADSVSEALSGGIECVYDGGDWSCTYHPAGYVFAIALSSGNNTLMGIAIGDTEEKVDKIMNEKGAVEGGYVLDDTGKSFLIEDCEVDCYFENNKVIHVFVL